MFPPIKESTEMKTWAQFDRKFEYVSGMTGIYQCYCNQKTFIVTLFQGTSSQCWQYFIDYLGGGAIYVKIMGVAIGIINNISFFTIRALATRIKFRSIVVRDRFIFVTLFLISYANSALFATDKRNEMEYLSIQWYSLFADMILVAVITTNLLPYLGVLIDLTIFKCCKKEKRSRKYFQFERKNAQILSTIFVCFTYGYGLPLIFIYLMVPLVLLSLLDRILIVYWFKPIVLQSDLLTKTFLDILKYGPVIFLIFAAFTLSEVSDVWEQDD